MNNSLLIISAILLFLITFLLGWALRWAGSPPPALLLALHKLIAQMGGVLLVASVFRQIPLQTAPPPALVSGGVAGLSFLGAVISGGLVSIAHPPEAARRLHRLLPYMVLLFAACSAYLLAAS